MAWRLCCPRTRVSLRFGGGPGQAIALTGIQEADGIPGFDTLSQVIDELSFTCRRSLQLVGAHLSAAMINQLLPLELFKA